MNDFISSTKEHTHFKSYKIILLFVFFITSLFVFAQKSNDDSNTVTKSIEELLWQYVNTRGNNIIVFDSSNIKQFWIDSSVSSSNTFINIQMESKESIPLKIQLANVYENQDCKIEVISETADYGFSIFNTNSKVLSSSKNEESFLNYSVSSSVFHLEDTINLSFLIKFNSKTENMLSIKKIILSFQNNNNSSFLSSPGKILHTFKDLSTTEKVTNIDTNIFSVTGKSIVIFSSKKIYVTTDNTLQSSVKIKNVGENAATIYFGYVAYGKNKTLLDGKNYPYKNINNVLNVVSISDSNDKIIVDKNTEWAKNCYLALDAKEDLSDIPSTSLCNGRIIQVRKIDDGHTEITLDKPFQTNIKKGSKVRVHGQGGGYLYTATKKLQPDEEYEFSAAVKKDDTVLEYSSKAFSKGVYYVVPLILSYSTDPNKENTILISNYSIEY